MILYFPFLFSINADMLFKVSQMHNIDNNGNIAICVLSSISSFLHSNGIVLVNSKFDITA